MQAIKDDNRRLAQTVSELRGERRVQDRRMRDLQRQLDEVRAKLVTTTLGAMPANLPVEVAAPPPGSAPHAHASSAASGDPTSRVVGVDDEGYEIVYEGDAAAGKVATLESDPAPRTSGSLRMGTPTTTTNRVAVPSKRGATPPPPREAPPERSPDAANAYRAAVELVRGGQTAESITALRGFLAKYPRHDYADNAQYWLGEAYYAAKDYPHALTEFRTVIETYPRGNKVPDALLKVGYCYQALGQAQQSRAVLEQVVSLYPKTEPAATAARRLETL